MSIEIPKRVREIQAEVDQINALLLKLRDYNCIWTHAALDVIQREIDKIRAETPEWPVKPSEPASQTEPSGRSSVPVGPPPVP